jgi:Mlc titration factor MtfA (ptsG expression regulator)
MFRYFKNRRRARLRAMPFPPAWEVVLDANAPACRGLPPDLRAQLYQHIQVFLAEKHFEGCNGFEITDDVRVTIAGQACLLLLNRETDYYPDLLTVLVYPSVFYADLQEPDESGHVVSEYFEDRSGESWDVGVVILSWEDIADYTSTGRSGYNVVLHEFAHQLDMENGSLDGMPRLGSRALRDEWARVFGEAYRRVERATLNNRRTLVDSYGIGDPAEFFAVVTESFFERPVALRREYPDLYARLSAYYCVDPAAWVPIESDSASSLGQRRARARRRKSQNRR